MKAPSCYVERLIDELEACHYAVTADPVTISAQITQASAHCTGPELCEDDARPAWEARGR
jgi:hypothetical protein